MELRILSAADVKRALPMAEAIAGMKSAYAQLSTGQAVMPLRSQLAIAPRQGTTLVMPAYLPQSEALTVKIVSVFPENSRRGEPVIYGVVLVLDESSGRPLALLDGGTLTAIRTGAGAGAATDLLARPDAEVVAILGSGVQARTQLEAVCTVRHINEVRVYSPTRSHAEAFAAEMGGHGPIPANIRVVADSDTAVKDADIICAATTAHTPVCSGALVPPGAHINGVGSYQPTMQEFDVATIQKSLVVVDSREAALAEAGELIIAIEQGAVTPEHIQTELGEIIAGSHPGRSDSQQITFFKSVGTAVQDAAAGQLALRTAASLNLGQTVSL